MFLNAFLLMCRDIETLMRKEHDQSAASCMAPNGDPAHTWVYTLTGNQTRDLLVPGSKLNR